MNWLENHWLDVLGWGGSALLVFSLLQTRVLRFRVLNLVACVVLVVFNGLISVWPMVAMNLVLCAINVWFIVRLTGERHDEAAFTVLEVAPGDAYLRHVLHVHSADIAKFQPGFVWDQGAANQHAFLVLRADETVGLVLLRVAERTAQVLLDYVTPRFRDFSPGEFVWRRSGLLSGLGVDRVITPAGMLEAYYGRLGFQRHGDRWVWNVPADDAESAG